VISSLVEFEEATAFERWALGALVPLPAARPHRAVKDIENNAVRVTAGTEVVRVYAGGIAEVQVDLRPLAFGAAWKVIDLLIELALSQAGLGTGGQMTIADKVKQVKKAVGNCPPLSSDNALWSALMSVYAGTEEIRHSLVHRRAEVDQATGELTGRDKNGQPLVPITAEQQEAFCRVAQRATQAVLAKAISPRERSDLAWNLDQLVNLHRQALLGGQQMAHAPLALAPTRMSGSAVLVNAPALLGELRKNFPDPAAYDASFELPDGRHLLVELDQAPSTEVAVDPGALPAWAVLWEGPG
jgi:hypothetical protein